MDFGRARNAREIHTSDRARAGHSGSPLRLANGRLAKRPDQAALDLLPDQLRIDDLAAIDGRDQPVDFDPLVGADACVGKQADMRSIYRAGSNSLRASRSAAVPATEGGRRLKTRREPRITASIAIRNATGSIPAARASSSMKLSVKKITSRCGDPRMYPASNGTSTAILSTATSGIA
jgi:hypothetical protein